MKNLVVIWIGALFLIGSIANILFAQQQPIRVEILEHKVMRVTVPNIRRADIVDIISGFFGRGDEAMKKKFQDLLGQSPQITLVMESSSK